MSTKKEVLNGAGTYESAKMINNNTARIIYPGGVVAVRLHATNVITFLPSGEMVLNSGGWQTVTTKERINRYSSARITQRGGQWFMRDGSLFYDGIVIDSAGAVTSERRKPNDKAVKNMKRKIKQYCDLLSADNLPQPGPGDCFLCRFQDKDPGHLLTHIDEGYIFGSILVEAMRAAGYRDEQIYLHYRLNLIDAFKRQLRKYLTKALIK
jgi:hypothetical protein